MKIKIIGVGLILSFAIAGTLKAQIVNIEEYRIRTDSIGWSGSADATAFINKNKELVFSILTNVQLQHKRPKTLWWMITDLGTVQANGQVAFVNAGFQHLRFNYKINEHWTWEVFAQGLFNKPLGVEWKVLSGAGPRYKVIQTESFRGYVAALYMQETERNVEATENIYFNRLSSYISFTWDIQENSRLSNTTYYQPVLNDFSDVRVSSTTSLKAFITKTLYVEMEYGLFLDTQAPVNVPNTSYVFKSGIGVEF